MIAGFRLLRLARVEDGYRPPCSLERTDAGG